jgi:hypothetical protein
MKKYALGVIVPVLSISAHSADMIAEQQQRRFEKATIFAQDLSQVVLPAGKVAKALIIYSGERKHTPWTCKYEVPQSDFEVMYIGETPERACYLAARKMEQYFGSRPSH